MAPKKQVSFEPSVADKVAGKDDRRMKDKENMDTTSIGIELNVTGIGPGRRANVCRSSSEPLLSSTSFQNRSSPPHPFHSSGRGSKQLTKALEHLEQRSEQLPGSVGSEHVMCYDPLCFAKVTSRQHDSIFIRPMRRSDTDPCLLVYENRVITTKNSTALVPVEMKHEFHGWRVCVPDDPPVLEFTQQLREERSSKLLYTFPLPGAGASTGALPGSGTASSAGCGSDVVSLDSTNTDLDENSSQASSSVFPLLGPEMPASGYGFGGSSSGGVTLTKAVREKGKGVCSTAAAAATADRGASAGYSSSSPCARLVPWAAAQAQVSSSSVTMPLPLENLQCLANANSSNCSSGGGSDASNEKGAAAPKPALERDAVHAPPLSAHTTAMGTVLDVHDAVRPAPGLAHAMWAQVSQVQPTNTASIGASTSSSTAASASTSASAFEQTDVPVEAVSFTGRSCVRSPSVTLPSGLQWHTVGNKETVLEQPYGQHSMQPVNGAGTGASSEGECLAIPPSTDTPVDRRPSGLLGPQLPRRRTATASTLFARSRYVPLAGAGDSCAAGGAVMLGLSSSTDSPLLEYPTASSGSGGTDGHVAVALSADLASHLLQTQTSVEKTLGRERREGEVGTELDEQRQRQPLYQLSESHVYERQRMAIVSSGNKSSGSGSAISGGWPSSYSASKGSAATMLTAIHAHLDRTRSGPEASSLAQTSAPGEIKTDAIAARLSPITSQPHAMPSSVGNTHKSADYSSSSEGDCDRDEDASSQGEGEHHSPTFSEMACDTSDSDADDDDDDDASDSECAVALDMLDGGGAGGSGDGVSLNMSASSVDADISRHRKEEDADVEDAGSADQRITRNTGDAGNVCCSSNAKEQYRKFQEPGQEPDSVLWDASRDSSGDGWPVSPIAQSTPDIVALGDYPYGQSTQLNALMNPVAHHQLSSFAHVTGGVALRVRGGVRGSWGLRDYEYADVSPSVSVYSQSELSSTTGANSNNSSGSKNSSTNRSSNNLVGAALASCSPSPRASSVYSSLRASSAAPSQRSHSSGLPPRRARADSAGSLLSTEPEADADTYAPTNASRVNASYDADTSVEFSDHTDLDLSSDSALELLLEPGEGNRSMPHYGLRQAHRQGGRRAAFEARDSSASNNTSECDDFDSTVSPSSVKRASTCKRGASAKRSSGSGDLFPSSSGSKDTAASRVRGLHEIDGGVALVSNPTHEFETRKRQRMREPSPASSGSTDMEEGSDRDSNEAVKKLRYSSASKLPMLPPPPAATAITAGRGRVASQRHVSTLRQPPQKRSLRERAPVPVHRDAVFGTWPTRHQSASTGAWRN